jgi:monofunctional biosynthetic peptidoglycan transglycosylase
MKLQFLLPFLPLVFPALPLNAADETMKPLISFDGAAAAPKWQPVNDGVMGGKSKGGPAIKEGHLVFSGSLSLENNGGFSSVRTTDFSADLSDAKRMTLRIKGDGRTYQLRLSTDARHRGSRIAYSADFATRAGEWQEVEVVFDKLVPTHHGRTLEGPPIDLSQIREVGLLIGDKKAGPFRLEVDWMHPD